jgi:hypothetical protein
MDPNAPKKPDNYWEQQAKEARARREYLQEQRTAEDIANPPPQEPPFKVTGGINLGQIDLQENMRRTEEKAEADRKEAQKQVAEERSRREAAEDRARALEVAALREQIADKMANLERMIAQGVRQPKSFLEQFEEVQSAATKLGMTERGNGGEDPKLKLELLKMQADMAREDRVFKQQMRNDDKRWNLELAKLDIEKKNHSERIAHEHERNEMFANAFKNVGAAIASGLMANAAAETGGGPMPGPIATKATPPRKRKAGSFKIQAAPGRAGAVACPQCGTEIGIGPTTVHASCAGCGFQCEVDRVQPEEKQPAERQVPYPSAPPPPGSEPPSPLLAEEELDRGQS